MREIKFRGKRIDTNEWLKNDSIMQFVNGITQLWENGTGWVYINPETIGQYTGLKDKNGKEIYEGDILEDEEVIIKVLYELDGFYGQIIKLKKICGTEVGLKYHLSFFQDDGNDLEVVGNIYDNPELLGGSNE